MREILFRGKRIDNGEWVEGYLIHDKHDGLYRIVIKLEYSTGTYIVTGFAPRVNVKTVGQYTGLTDKNGKRIFEGDIVAQSWYDFDEPADDSFGEVIFSVADCSFSILDFNKNEIMSMGQGRAYHWEAEVIGNIHDNSELMKDK